MPDIEHKALELVNAVQRERGEPPLAIYNGWANDRRETVALIRALEAHEADKSRHAAEMQEQAERFSEAVRDYMRPDAGMAEHQALAAFIIANPDPLVEAIRALEDGRAGPTAESKAACLRNAADELGYTLAIVKKEAVNG